MGKSKAQRTKNNAQPSNSRRSAELLGTSASTFIGFKAGNNEEYASASQGFSIAVNVDVTPTFQIVFKKMTKKNAITKHKALEELTNLCANADLTEVKNILTFWSRYYGFLSIDINHRVREAAQIAHATILNRVGKAIAVHLKEFAGPWFVSQYDTYPPVASAATNSFNTTFPLQKSVLAIVHCQNEILNYICDNITVVTPQSLSANNSTPGEVEMQYQKLVTSSLQAYIFYLKTVKPSDIEQTINYHKKLISNSRFWQFTKNEVPSIRTVCFGTLTALICHANSIACEEKKKILTTIMNSLDEIDPALLIAVWECLLTAINNIENWYKVVSLEKLILPKLWRILRSGGQNCATIVYPHLLPFLSHFTKLEINTTTLFTNFFENMRQGFSAKSVKLSRSKASTVVTSFFECFRYAVLINSNNEEVCKCLLKDQLMIMIELCINKELTMRPIFFSKLNSLIRYWNKNSDNPEYSAYAKLLKIFWFELMAIFNRLIDSSNENHNITTSFVISSMLELLEHLNKEPCDDRRPMKITFWDSQAKSSEEPPKTSSIETKFIADKDNDTFTKQVEQFIIKFCVSYFKRVADKRKIIDLVKIITNHGSKELLIALANTNNENASLLNFYDQNLRILLTGEDINIEDLMNFIFIVMSYMDDVEKDVVLQTFLEADDVNMLKIALQYALTDRYREDTVIRKWHREKVITNTLVLTAQDVLSTLEVTDSDQKLFLKAFEPALDGDLIISNEAVCGILSLFCLIVDRLPWNNEKQAERIVNLSSQLLNLSWTHKEVNGSAIKLLEALFHLLTNDNIEQNEIDGDTPIKSIVQEMWIKGLCEIKKRMSADVFDKTVKYFTSIIWEKMLLKNYTSDSSNANELLIDIAEDFIATLIKINEIKTNEYIENFIMELEIKQWMKCLSTIALSEEVITGKFYVSESIIKGCVFNEVFDIDLCTNYLENDIEKCLKWALYSSKILDKLLEHLPENSDSMSEIFTNISYVVVLSELHVENDIFVKSSKDVHLLCKSLQSFFKHLGHKLPANFHIKVTSNIIQLLLSYGGIYQYLLKFYYSTFKNNINQCDLFTHIYSSSITEFDNNQILLQSMQILDDCELYINLKSVLPPEMNENFLIKIFLASNALNENEKLIENIFETIRQCHELESSYPLFHCNICEMTWESFSISLAIMSFWAKYIDTVPENVKLYQWIYITKYTMLWILSIETSINYLDDFKVKAFIIGVNKVYVSIQKAIQNKNLSLSCFTKLMRDIFFRKTQPSIFKLWMKCAEFYHDKKDLPVTSELPLRYLGMSLKYFDRPIVNDDTSQNTEYENISKDEIMPLLLKLLYSPVESLQTGTYIALNNLMNTLVKQDTAYIELDDLNCESLHFSKFIQVLKTTEAIVNAMLMEFKPCDFTNCIIQPHTDSYTYTIGYLFTWIIVLNMCAKVNRDVRYQYAEKLKEDLFSNLLTNIFRLMPTEITVKRKSCNYQKMFTQTPTLNFINSGSEERIEHLVCYLYMMSLKYLPVLVRQWLSVMEKRVQTQVNLTTEMYISPVLLRKELEHDMRKVVDHMQIEKNPYTREIVVTYFVEDTKLEFDITFPTNYPLSSVTVQPKPHMSGIQNQRNCHMQLFLEYQNGTIFDGLMSWKTNLDSKLAGLEKCYICFNIFHTSTYQIPKLSCGTCRKKYHPSCLYKWFNKSYKSTCPLCRNIFSL